MKLKSIPVFKIALQFKVIGLLVSSVILSSCAQTSSYIQRYDGAKRLPNEVAQLIVANELEILEIDGRSFKTPYTASGIYQVDLLPGKHELTIIYSAFWGTASEGAIETSNDFLFQFSLDAGQTYVFNHDAPENLETANFGSIGSDVKIWVSQQSSGKIIQASDSVEGGGLLSPVINKIVTRDPQPTNSSSQLNPLDQLKQSWMESDDKQRKAFKEWVNKRSLDGKGI